MTIEDIYCANVQREVRMELIISTQKVISTKDDARDIGANVMVDDYNVGTTIYCST